MTFFYVCYFIQIRLQNGSDEPTINAVSLGIALFTCYQIASGITGGCLNPAIGIVQPRFQKYLKKQLVHKSKRIASLYQLMYMLGPLLGGFLGAVFHIVFLGPAHLHSQMVQVQEYPKRQKVKLIVAKGKIEEVNSNIAINISIGAMNSNKFEEVDEEEVNPTGVEFYVID